MNYIQECCLVFLVKKSKKEQQLCEEMFWASWAVPGILVEGEGPGDGSIGVFLGISILSHRTHMLATLSAGKDGIGCAVVGLV